MEEIDMIKLQTVIDKQEISDCIIRLARGMDRHDVELARSTMAEDSYDDHVTFIGSGWDMIDWANAYHDQTLKGHMHCLTNMSIEVNGDEAHAETYVNVIGITRDWNHSIGGGRYLDRLERRNGNWLIVHRVTITEWWDDPDVIAQASDLVYGNAQDKTDPSYLRPLNQRREARNISAQRNAFQK